MQNEIQWYDSDWLNCYLNAKEVIRQNYPLKLEQFIKSFDVLRTKPDFKIKEIKNLFNLDTLGLIKQTIKEIPMSRIELHEVQQFGRFIVHDNPVFLKLQSDLSDRVSEWAGEEVEPCYNFLSLYTRLGICEPHIDAPDAKWTLDICIEQSEPWPIHFSQIIPWPEECCELGEDWRQAIKNDPALTFETKMLEPGDAILFAGSSQWHYRDALQQASRRSYCNLLFFHYIPKGTSELVSPKNWARIFGIPELAIVAKIYYSR